MSEILDLRSDTKTLPTPEMREAMKKAEVGDETLEEDPTINKLIELGKSILGMEAGLFAISGTMANEIAVMTLTERGQEVIVSENSHIYNLEVAGLAVLSQVQVRPIKVNNGYYDPEIIEKAIQPEGIQRAKTGLICLENTHDLNKGSVVEIDNMSEIKNLASEYGIPVYLDGARLFNAAAKLKVNPSEICQYVDAVQICLTKGLGAPVGSLLLGDKDFINKARWSKQRLGGGLRQAGMMAAPAIIGLEKVRKHIEKDNENALKLAENLSKIDGLKINIANVHTNIFTIKITKDNWNTDKLIKYLSPHNIKVRQINLKEIRMVTHHQISDENIDYIIDIFKNIFSK